MKKVFDCIFERKSIRSFNGKPLSDDNFNNIQNYVNNLKSVCEKETSEEKRNEFDFSHGTKNLQFFLIRDFDPNTYFVRGCTDYIVMVGPKNLSRDLTMKSGFFFEKIVLYCWSIGVGTCWIGGTWITKEIYFHDKKLRKLGKKSPFDFSDSQVLAMSPIGVAAKAKRRVDSFIRYWSGGDVRIEPERLFFEGKIGVPLDYSKVDENRQKILEAFRWAPSSSNTQRWKIIKEKDKGVYHFFTNPTSKFYSNMDIGIGLCHWEVACKNFGIKGKFVKLEDIDGKIFEGKVKRNRNFVTDWIYKFGQNMIENRKFSLSKNIGDLTSCYFVSWVEDVEKGMSKK